MMANKEREKELKELMKETMKYIDSKMATVEKSIIKYADKTLSK